MAMYNPLTVLGSVIRFIVSRWHEPPQEHHLDIFRVNSRREAFSR